MSIVSPKTVVGKAKAGWTSYRGRHPWLEHVLAAYSRMNRTNANQYAAAITYFSFLALFPLLLLAVAVVGYVLFFEPHLQTELFSKITDQVPGTLGSTLKSAVSEAIAHRNSVGVIGVLGVLLTGLGWIGNLRQSIDAVWGQQAPKRNFLTSRTTNLGVLAGLGLGVVVSVGLTVVGTSVTTQILDAVGLETVPGATVLLKVIGIAIAAVGDMIVFWWLLVRLPAVHLDRRIMLKGVLMASIGFEILKIVGTYTVAHAVQSATAGPFALPVALLVWIQLVCRFMLFCCSWMAVLRDDAARVAEVGAIIEPPPAASPAVVPTIRPATVGATLVGAGAVAGAAAATWVAASLTPARRRQRIVKR